MTLTVGELLVNRRLKIQNDLYVPGQAKARVPTPEDALVSYVDGEGGLCILACRYDEDEGDWVHRGTLLRVTPETAAVRPLPRGRLSAVARDAILAEEKARRPTTIA